MNSSLIILMLIFIAYIFLKGNIEYGKRNLIIFGCILLTLESGLRHISVGPDTYTYYKIFISTCDTSWNKLFTVIFDSASELRDPAFLIVQKIFYSIVPSWQIFLLFVSSFYFYALGRLFNKYIPSISGVFFAFVLYLALFHIIALSGIRQQITMSLSMLIIPWINDRKWFKTLIVICVGSMIHISMLFIVLLIPLMYVSPQKAKLIYIFAILLIPIVAINARPIVAYMASFLESDYYSQYAKVENQANPMLYVILCSLISIYQCYNSKYLLRIHSIRFIVPTCILMTLFVPLIFLDGTMIRIGQYFTLYMMVSLPVLFLKVKCGRIIQLIMILYLSFTILRNPVEYSFFWTYNPIFLY